MSEWVRQRLHHLYECKQQQNFPAALRVADEVLRSFPHHPTALGQKAHLLHLLGKTADGLQLLSDCGPPDGYPDYVQAVQAELMWAHGRQEEAQALIDRLASLPGLSDAAFKRVAELLKLSGDTDRACRLVDRWVSAARDRKAAMLFQATIVDDPELVLRRLLSDYPDDPQVLKAITKQRLEPLPLEEAVEELEVLLQTSRGADNVELRCDYAMKLRQAGQLEAALVQFERCLQSDPQYLRARTHMGYCLGKLERWEAAVDALEECIPHDPRNLVLKRALFAYYRASGQMARARSLVETMVARHPELRGPYYGELKKTIQPDTGQLKLAPVSSPRRRTKTRP